MAQVEPTGVLGAPLAALRNLLVNLAAFRTWCGAGSPTLAHPHVHFHGVSPSDVMWPFVVVGLTDPLWEESARLEGDALSTGNDFGRRGVVYATFCEQVSSEYRGKDGDAITVFGNALGPVLSALEGAARSNGWLYIAGWNFRLPPVVSDVIDDVQVGRHVKGVVRVRWGMGL